MPRATSSAAKDKSADRIDGVVASVMALGRILVTDEPWERYTGPRIWLL